ncbi:Epidermal growth factor receptor substrate 15-like 1, partial [Armadillidium nasatum]
VAGDHFQLFELWYHKLDPKNLGSIPAGPAASFLKKSGLNENILSRIWDISDPGGKGYLDKAGLFVALKLVALVQNGKEPSIANISFITSPPNMGEAPPHPPPPLSKSPGPPLVPAPPAPTTVNSAGVWTITPADRARYDQIFNSLGPEANKIHGNKVRGVMLNSKLSTDILGKIWDLADMDKDGNLDKVEFSIAMHLIYKVLENNPLPATLPQEMLSSARRAGVAGQGPVPAPLAPPSQTLLPDNNKLQSSGPPPAPWVVSAADKARYDVMFHNADIDKDGFVSGQEIKGVFLQSGLPQMVLAHIWNLCDMKQTGKLTSEQFALAMWLIQQKIAGVDPPSTLTPEMIPPTMRPKPTTEPPVVAKPTYSNPELQAVADEIEELNKDKLKLETDIQQKEASIRLKNNEIKNLQTELDTLSATLKQLENQKGAAQKRLDDLGQQKISLEQEYESVEDQIRREKEEVTLLSSSFVMLFLYFFFSCW